MMQMWDVPTYLAVDSSCSIKERQIENHGNKRSHASEGVHLPKSPFSKRLHVGWGKTKKRPVVTDPYRPPVGEFPSYDVELVIKGCDELPARSRGLAHLRMGGGHGKGDLQEDAICDKVEALECHYREMSSSDVLCCTVKLEG